MLRNTTTSRGFSGLPRALQAAYASPRRSLATKSDLPFTDICPSPHCQCLETPEGLDIDHRRPLLGTKPEYDLHLLVKTASADWPSRFEDEDTLAAKVKKAFSKGGRYHSVSQPSITA